MGDLFEGITTNILKTPSLRIFNHLPYHQSPRQDVEGEHMLLSNKPSEGLEKLWGQEVLAFIWHLLSSVSIWGVPLRGKHHASQREREARTVVLE